MASSTEHALHAAYEAEALAQTRAGVSTGCLLALVFVPLFALQDAASVGFGAIPALGVRGGCMLGVAGVYGLLRTRLGARYPRVLGLVIATLLGLMVDWIAIADGSGGGSPRYASLNLIGLAGALLLPLSRGWVVIGTLLLGGLYAVLMLATGSVHDPHVFGHNLTYLFGTTGICFVSARYREQLRWREFQGRVALRDALRLQGEFTAKMSHEIRTPINVMIGYADILLDGALEQPGADRRRLVERVRSQGVKLRHLISDLLDYTKAGAGKLPLHPEPLTVREVVDEIADSFRPIAERKGIQVRTVYGEHHRELTTDRQRLGQILTNVVANAVKFTERGEVVLEVMQGLRHGGDVLGGFTLLDDGDARPCAGTADDLVILVRDTGIGIRAADIARLASDYEQIDGADHKYGGTGLGLSIAKKLAQLLGGRLAVASVFGEGTTFALSLPVRSSVVLSSAA